MLIFFLNFNTIRDGVKAVVMFTLKKKRFIVGEKRNSPVCL